MAYTALSTTPRHPSVAGTLIDGLSSLRTRISASWRQRREERMLESLPYDTLKDIGFPAANTARGDIAAR